MIQNKANPPMLFTDVMYSIVRSSVLFFLALHASLSEISELETLKSDKVGNS